MSANLISAQSRANDDPNLRRRQKETIMVQARVTEHYVIVPPQPTEYQRIQAAQGKQEGQVKGKIRRWLSHVGTTILMFFGTKIY